MVADRNIIGGINMGIIGTFTETGNGFAGTIKTLSVNAKVTFKANTKDNEKAPDYHLYAGDAEVGAGWKKTSQHQRDYVSAKLDDPSFPAPVFARLFKDTESDKYSLIRTRNGE